MNSSEGTRHEATFLSFRFLVIGYAALPVQACSSHIPQMPACNVPKCIDGIWQPWPVPAATSCNSGLGYCDGGVITPGQIEAEQAGTCVGAQVYKPNFSLQSIIYMPPGKQSSVTYGNGSSEGSRISTQTTTSRGTSVGIQVLRIGASTGYNESVISGKAMAVTKADANILTESVNTGSDFPNRNTDLFTLWLNNVQLNDYHSTSNGWETLVWTTSDGNGPQIFTYSAAELNGTATPLDSPPGRVAALATLNSSDRNAILSMDAPYSGTALAPKRYQFVDKQNSTMYMDGPDYAGYPVNSYSYSLAYNQSWDTTNGSSVNSSSQALGGFNIGVFHAGATYTWTQTFTDTRTSTTGDQQTASLTLRTPTVGCYMAVNVYIDAVFGTYLALPSTVSNCN